METISRGVWPVLLAALTGCASLSYGALSPPGDGAALGLAFGAERAAAEEALRAAGIGARPAADDPDALVADRCPSAPAAAPCRLFFGPRGLYAAQLEVPASDAGALAGAVAKGLGRPDRGADPAATAAEGVPALLAGWIRPGWTVTVARLATPSRPALALLRVERDEAAPPVVAGVALGRLRAEVELALERQGAVLVQRDGGTSTYLGCPQGEAEALSCVVVFRGGRAASVTEVRPAAGDDREALAAWRVLARRFERDVGRPPQTVCPAGGPDRVGGGCTATWTSDRLVVVVGAHRNAGARHRGTISVYTAFSYPPLAASDGEDEARWAR